MFTSSVGNEGKSTLALMAAFQLQRTGQKTLLLDCEPGNPVFSTLPADTPSSGGLNSVLSKKRLLKEAIVRDEATGLSWLSLHAEDGSEEVPIDQLQGDGFRRILDDLRQEFDSIVLNAQPVLLASDAKSLAAEADAIVMVVRWNYTKREALEDALADLESVGAQITGLIMNVVNERKAEPYEPGGYQYYRNRSRRKSDSAKGILPRPGFVRLRA
jgi:succinoglycan biosynthesis transport protein ExoP